MSCSTLLRNIEKREKYMTLRKGGDSGNIADGSIIWDSTAEELVLTLYSPAT